MHRVPIFGTCPARLRKRRSATYRPCSGHKEGERLDVRPRPSAGPRPEAPPGPPTCLRPRPTRARFSTRPAYPSQARPHRPRRLPPAQPRPLPEALPRPSSKPRPPARGNDPAGTAQFPEAPPHPPPGPPICPMLRPPPGLRVGPRPQPRSVAEHPWRQAPGTLILWVPREAGSGVSALGFSLKWAQTHTGSPIRALTASHHLTDEDGETRVETGRSGLCVPQSRGTARTPQGLLH